jgi:predicted enzyme related to lactoylglutathione lyase
VADLEEAMRRCESGGGKILRRPNDMGSENRFCVIRDPAGAVAALYESRSPQP